METGTSFQKIKFSNPLLFLQSNNKTYASSSRALPPGVPGLSGSSGVPRSTGLSIVAGGSLEACRGVTDQFRSCFICPYRGVRPFRAAQAGRVLPGFHPGQAVPEGPVSRVLNWSIRI